MSAAAPAVQLQDYDGICVVTAGGDLTAEAVDRARDQIEDLIEQKQVAFFVFDLTSCHYFDSAGLELITWMQVRCDELFGHFVVVGLTPNATKILEITRLLPRLDISDDLNDAVKRLR